MALIPLIFDLAKELRTVYNDFGFGIYPHELIRVDSRPIQRHRLLPKSRFRISSPYSAKKHKPGDIQHVGKDGFQVSMDVQQFRPNEITVKTVDNTVVIEAKHEEREDEHGTISRHFVRKYTLPKGYDSKDVVSTISSDGVLTVKAPLPPEKKSKCKERVVQIQQTGPACDSIKANSCEETKSQEMNGDAQR